MPAAALGAHDPAALADMTCSVDAGGTVTLSDGAVAGTLYRPPGNGPFPTVLWLLGQNGKLDEAQSASAAAMGDYVVLSRGGIGAGPLPPSARLLGTRLA